MNVEIKNIEIKSIKKLGTEYNNKKFSLTQNHQKIYQKDDEIEIKKIKMKKFSTTNNNFKLSKDKKINEYNNNMMYRHNTFLKNKKSEINKKKNKLSKDPKTTIITPQEINKEITIENTFSHKKQNQKIDENININMINYTKKKESKKIAKNLSKENMYINASNINNTFNNFLLGGTQRKKITFKEFDKQQKNNKILKLYNLNNNIYNDETTLINNTNINDLYTTNYTTKNNKNYSKNAMGSGNKNKKSKKMNFIHKCNQQKIEHFMFNPAIKIDTNYINNIEMNSIISDNNIKNVDLRSGGKKLKKNENLIRNNSKKNVVKNIKDIIIENSNKNNINLIHSFKSELNIHNNYNVYNTFNTNESKQKDSKRKSLKTKIQNLKISQRGPNSSEFNIEANHLSCKNKLKNKVIKLKDVNKNFNKIINNGLNFNSTIKNSSSNNIYTTYINNTSSSNNNKPGNFNNLYGNSSNSNLKINNNLSKEKIKHRNSLIKLNTLQNEDDIKTRPKYININYNSRINISPPKIPFLRERSNNKLHIKLKHPFSNKNINSNQKINYSPKVNSIPKYIKTESNISNANITNNNNIILNNLDFMENYAMSSRKENIFSKINNYMLKGHNVENNIIDLLNGRKFSSKKDNNKRNNLLKIINTKEKYKETNLNKKRLRKIDYNNDTININNTNNKNSLFNYGAKTTKNINNKDILLNKKYSFINILKPKTINKLKRYAHLKNNEENYEERIIMNSLKKEEKRKEDKKDNSKLLTNNNKSLTFIYKEKKKKASSILKQKNLIKLIHMIDELNLNSSKAKSKSKSKKKNKSLQQINFMGTSSKKDIKKENIKVIEDKNIIENVIQNNMAMYSIYLLSKYENNYNKIGIAKIALYDKNNNEINILYSNSNSNMNNNICNNEEENTNYLFNEKNNKPFVSEFKENLYINFYLNVKKANNLRYIKIVNYENKNDEISPIKEIKIYRGKKKLFNGVLINNYENVIDISEQNNRNKEFEQSIKSLIIPKKRGNSASNGNNKTNIYNINYINYKKNNNIRSYSTFRKNSGKKINRIPKKQIVKIKSEREISPKAHYSKISNIYNNTEINEDTYYDNNNIIIYNICNTIPYNNCINNETKDEINLKKRYISENDLENSNKFININDTAVHEGINITKLNLNNYNDDSNANTIFIDNSNCIKFKIIRLVLSSNYGNNNSIGLTGLEFYDKNNKLINIETAETIGALPKDLHTIYNDENDNRIFENIFNGENNTDDSFNMWLTLFNSKKKEKSLPYIELSFNEIIYLSKIKFFNYNKINQLDKCLKTVDLFFDNKFYGQIYLRQGLGFSFNDNIIQKENNDKNNHIINNYSQDIVFPLNNEYFENIYRNKNKFEINSYNEKKGLDIEYASLKYEQSYETPYIPNGFIIRFQLINNFYQGKVIENNNKITNNINNISLRNNNYIGINISKIYDKNGKDLLIEKEDKYKIVCNKEIIILGENRYILYYTANDDNNNLFFLFDNPIDISYIEIKPFSFSDKDENFSNSVKDIKIFCDTSVIFEGQIYQFQPTSILFTSDDNILKNVNKNYLTKNQINREFTETKTDDYYSMTFL